MPRGQLGQAAPDGGTQRWDHTRLGGRGVRGGPLPPAHAAERPQLDHRGAVGHRPNHRRGVTAGYINYPPIPPPGAWRSTPRGAAWLAGMLWPACARDTGLPRPPHVPGPRSGGPIAPFTSGYIWATLPRRLSVLGPARHQASSPMITGARGPATLRRSSAAWLGMRSVPGRGSTRGAAERHWSGRRGHGRAESGALTGWGAPSRLGVVG